MIISKIKKKPYQRGIYQIFVDGKFWAEILDETILKFSLACQKEYSENFLKDVLASSKQPLAMHLALNYLERYFKTKKEIKDYLFKKGFEKNDIDLVVMRLEKNHLLNDQKFAEIYVAKHKTKGKRALRFDLKIKGIDTDIIENTLKKIENQEEVMLSLAQKFIKNKKSDPKIKEKLFRHLVSKGFEFEEVKIVCKKVLEEQNESWN